MNKTFYKRLLSIAICATFAFSALGETKELSLLFVGDVMLDELPGEYIKNKKDPFESFQDLITKADIRVANLECVISSKGEKLNKIYTFRASPEVLPTLTQSFNLLGLANNHSGDYGPDAFNDMLNLFKAKNIAFFGGGDNIKNAHKPFIWTQNGIKIAFIGYNEMMPRSFEADLKKPGIAWSEDEQVVYDIKTAKSKYHADLVIAVMHWGWEYETRHSQRQENLAHLMINAGADAIIGAHPHVIQDIEIYKQKPIFYSLGNFVFNGFTRAEENHGWILSMKANSKKVYDWKVVDAYLDAQGIPRKTLSKAHHNNATTASL